MTKETETQIASDEEADAIPQIEVAAEVYWRGHAYLRHDQPHLLR